MRKDTPGLSDIIQGQTNMKGRPPEDKLPISLEEVWLQHPVCSSKKFTELKLSCILQASSSHPPVYRGAVDGHAEVTVRPLQVQSLEHRVTILAGLQHLIWPGLELHGCQGNAYLGLGELYLWLEKATHVFPYIQSAGHLCSTRKGKAKMLYT